MCALHSGDTNVGAHVLVRSPGCGPSHAVRLSSIGSQSNMPFAARTMHTSGDLIGTPEQTQFLHTHTHTGRMHPAAAANARS